MWPVAIPTRVQLQNFSNNAYALKDIAMAEDGVDIGSSSIGGAVRKNRSKRNKLSKSPKQLESCSLDAESQIRLGKVLMSCPKHASKEDLALQRLLSKTTNSSFKAGTLLGNSDSQPPVDSIPAPCFLIDAALDSAIHVLPQTVMHHGLPSCSEEGKPLRTETSTTSGVALTLADSRFENEEQGLPTATSECSKEVIAPSAQELNSKTSHVTAASLWLQTESMPKKAAANRSCDITMPILPVIGKEEALPEDADGTTSERAKSRPSLGSFLGDDRCQSTPPFLFAGVELATPALETLIQTTQARLEAACRLEMEDFRAALRGAATTGTPAAQTWSCSTEIAEEQQRAKDVKHDLCAQLSATSLASPAKQSVARSKRNSCLAMNAQVHRSEMLLNCKSEEPKNLYQRIGAWLSGDTFEIIIGSLIMLNMVVMICQVQYDGIEVGNTIAFKGYPQPAAVAWPHGDNVLSWLDMAFTVIFMIDVTLRVVFLNVMYFKTVLNWIDIVIVAISLVAILFSSLGNPSFVRMLRLVKLARGLRTLQSSPAVQSLQVLIKCLASSLNTLGWSLCVIFVIQCIAAMLLANFLHQFLNDETIDVSIRQEVFRYYGTFTLTIMTMFEILYANWIPACRLLIDNLGEHWALFFVLYRCLVGWAVLSVVNAVFVQSTMKVAQDDQEILIAQKARAQKATQKSLMRLFWEMDASHDGELSYSELKAVLEDPKLKLWMDSLEIDTKDLKLLFALLDDGQGTISIEEFMGGIERVKGNATAFDMAAVIKTLERVEQRLEKLAACAHDSSVLNQEL
eukprot:TRINITY_DN90862_c0_g1_i1.p1 TRINITY_DN90862_c0_g1~~TRINITY_DN90862_c0_g1_i1.p1  ORF type:complete len:799 (-),score=152.93 TRINITY_DN90862_c0_g1_i1:259-2655(-)